MIPGFNRADELDPPPSAPDPHSTVRHDIAPPAPLLIAASAWRSTVRPPPRRASPWPSAAAMLAMAGLLSLYIWTLSAHPVAEAVATPRSAAP